MESIEQKIAVVNFYPGGGVANMKQAIMKDGEITPPLAEIEDELLRGNEGGGGLGIITQDELDEIQNKINE